MLLLKKTLLVLSMLFSFWHTGESFAQAPAQKMSVTERLTKARAAKADKKALRGAGGDSMARRPPGAPPVAAAPLVGQPRKVQKATPADYQSPVDKSKHGPNGEVIYKGARGAAYYINKNGNKTYLSSNQ